MTSTARSSFRCEKQSLCRGVQMKMIEVAIAKPRKCNRLDKFEWLIQFPGIAL